MGIILNNNILEKEEGNITEEFKSKGWKKGRINAFDPSRCSNSRDYNGYYKMFQESESADIYKVLVSLEERLVIVERTNFYGTEPRVYGLKYEGDFTFKSIMRFLEYNVN